MKSPAPNKRFLRAVREGRIYVQAYMNSTKGVTWRSLPFGMWFVITHETDGYVTSPYSKQWAGLPDRLIQEPGMLVEITQKGIDWLSSRA